MAEVQQKRGRGRPTNLTPEQQIEARKAKQAEYYRKCKAAYDAIAQNTEKPARIKPGTLTPEQYEQYRREYKAAYYQKRKEALKAQVIV